VCARVCRWFGPSFSGKDVADKATITGNLKVYIYIYIYIYGDVSDLQVGERGNSQNISFVGQHFTFKNV
jgi:hypothetical protein